MHATKKVYELLDLTDKVAIVTGGAKGIGYAIASRLAEAGANVLIADIDGKAASAAAQKLEGRGLVVQHIVINVASEAGVKDMLATCGNVFGALDVLVNNAGIYPSQPLSHMSEVDFERVMRINLRSVFLTTKYASQVMAESGGGKIINITSIDALHPSMTGLSHYDASKHGVWGFTKNTALELAPLNIQVNAIAPGGVMTEGVEAMSRDASAVRLADLQRVFAEKIPMHRMGDADEIGKVALFLASDMSSYMTGSQVVVDGGALLA